MTDKERFTFLSRKMREHVESLNNLFDTVHNLKPDLADLEQQAHLDITLMYLRKYMRLLNLPRENSQKDIKI